MSPRRPLRPDYHDPTAGIGGAPAAVSALGLRAALAIFGVVVCGGGAAVAAASGAGVVAGVLALLALVAIVDLAVIVGRSRRGDPPA